MLTPLLLGNFSTQKKVGGKLIKKLGGGTYYAMYLFHENHL